MANVKFISYETLFELYIKQRKTQKQIAETLGVTIKTVQNYMALHNIKGRDVNKENSLLAKLNVTDEQFKNTLKFKYEFQKTSIIKLAREFDVSARIISKYLERYQIPLRNHKESNRVSNSGSDNPKWNGGKRYHSDGYIQVLVPNHPHSVGCGYVYEHRVIMEQHVGRFLERDEHVHHLNGNKTDNRIENLQLLSASEHAKLHVHEKLHKAKGKN
jgi:transcriptional regulator with XRE-family HTH domain/uncharacterized protein (DUF1330 family)